MANIDNSYLNTSKLGIQLTWSTWPRFRCSVVGSTSSSPVESTAIVGVGYTYKTLLCISLLWIKIKCKMKFWCHNTFTIITPTVASKPISEAPTSSPDFNTLASFWISHPWPTNILVTLSKQNLVKQINNYSKKTKVDYHLIISTIGKQKFHKN